MWRFLNRKFFLLFLNWILVGRLCFRGEVWGNKYCNGGVDGLRYVMYGREIWDWVYSDLIFKECGLWKLDFEILFYIGLI